MTSYAPVVVGNRNTVAEYSWGQKTRKQLLLSVTPNIAQVAVGRTSRSGNDADYGRFGWPSPPKWKT